MNEFSREVNEYMYESIIREMNLNEFLFYSCTVGKCGVNPCGKTLLTKISEEGIVSRNVDIFLS